MNSLQKLWQSALHLFYPHTCVGCGSDLLPQHELLCATCILQLPHTHFASLPDNPVAQLFTGRLDISTAFSQLYFTKEGLVQRLVHELKYKGNQDIGLYLGRMMGQSLLQTNYYQQIDCLVPLPLYATKERQRGFNQATVLCRGMAEVLHIHIDTKHVIRQRPTQTQTRKQRTSRWQNVAGSFAITQPNALVGKHILLVDDVVTTGATLDACGNALLQLPGTTVSIATLACALK